MDISFVVQVTQTWKLLRSIQKNKDKWVAYIPDTEDVGVLRLQNKLARFKPIYRLTGKDEEWVELQGGTFQNKRNSAVFKDGKDGIAYFIDAYSKKTPNGTLWGGKLNLKDGRTIGRCYIRDYSNMPTIIVDVLEKEVAKDDWEMWIKDESQLDELAKYYKFDIT